MGTRGKPFFRIYIFLKKIQLVFFLLRRETPEDSTSFYSRSVPPSRTARVQESNVERRNPNALSNANGHEYEIPRDNMGYEHDEEVEMSTRTPTGNHYERSIIYAEVS